MRMIKWLLIKMGYTIDRFNNYYEISQKDFLTSKGE